MSSTQKRILWAVAMFSFVFNLSCLGFCYWNDNEMEKAGISIEAILAEGRR